MREFADMSDRLWEFYFDRLDFGSIEDVDMISYPDKFVSAKRDLYTK